MRIAISQAILGHHPKNWVIDRFNLPGKELMVFVRQTPSKLTIWDVSASFWAIVFSFGLMGAYFISSSFSVTTLSCRRWLQNQGSCMLFEFIFPFPRMREIPLNTLQGAYFKSNFSGRTSSYKIVLLTQSGEIHITNSSHSGEKEYIASQIDTFIKNPNQTSLNVRQEGQLVDLFFGLLFWVGGVFCLLWQGDQIEFLTCSWDKTHNRIVLQQRNFLSLSTGQLEWSIDDIDSATIESTVHSKLNRSFQTVTYKKYYLVLGLKSGERLRLTFYETVLLKNKEKVVQYISSLLSKTSHFEHSTQEVEKLAKKSTIEQEIASWKEAICVSPDNAEAHYHLGLALYRHNQRQDATDSLERAKGLFKSQGNSKKADEVQSVLWELGLE